VFTQTERFKVRTYTTSLALFTKRKSFKLKNLHQLEQTLEIFHFW